MNNHKCLITKPDERDFLAGVNSPIPFKAVNPSGDWTAHLDFFEKQSYGWDCDGCVLFSAQESFDAQMDLLIPTFPPSVVSFLNQQGYMDAGRDGAVHFHSSPRFLQVLTGNKFNGNSLQDPWTAMRAYGVLPWKDLPFDSTITQAEYLNPIPQALLDKAMKFLIVLGGKDAIKYHWIVSPNGANNIPAMKSALPQAPLCVGVPVNSDWNQVQPVDDSGLPAHSVQNYLIDSFVEIEDHYIPEFKKLALTYKIPQVIQGILSPIFTPIPPAPTPAPDVLTPTPNISDTVSWLSALVLWLQNVLNRISGIKGDTETKVADDEITFMPNQAWWVSSSGTGIAQRIVSLVALVLPILSLFGINITLPDVTVFVNALLIVIFAVWQAWAWGRAKFNKQNNLGKYAIK